MKTAHSFFVVALAASVAGCATGPGTKGFSPAQSVYALEGAYASALHGAVAYRNLPVCPSVQVCHSPTVVARLIAADDKAHAALVTAETVVRAHGAQAQITAALTSAQQLIATFAAQVTPP